MLMRFYISVFWFLIMIGCSIFVTKTSFSQTNLLSKPNVFQAIEKQDAEALRAHLIRGDSPNMSNFENVSALMMAVRMESHALIEVLLEFDALPNLQDNLGNTALFYAVGKNAYDVTKQLLDNGADPNITNRQGVTPFLNALANSDVDIVKMLIEAGADKSLQDYTGRGALEWARDNRQRAVYQLVR